MKKSTILVVDDELFFRRLYTELLSEEGYEVEAAASGDKALERLRQGGVDIVLTDMVMPGLSGMEVLRRARSMNNPPEVILVTGHATLETAIQALKNGARDYLIKPFNPEELRHLIRTCLEQRRLLDENILLKSQISLFRKGQNLASLLELDLLLPEAVKALIQEVGEGRGFAFLSEGGTINGLYGLEGLNEIEAMALVRAILPLLESTVGMRRVEAAELPLDPSWPGNVQSLFLFPLHGQKIEKGSVVVLNPATGAMISPLPQENLLFLSEQTALGFDNACRYQGARQMMYTDDLTELYNYRYMQMMLDQEIRRSERYSLCFSLVFIDLDHFKEINDTHGHLAGSATLKEVAVLLKQSVRDVDVLFRYGGDEFTAMLVETDYEGAKQVAERMRKTIEEHCFLAGGDLSCRLTATIGYATFPSNAGDKKSIIDLADRAMYQGKQVRNVTRGAWETGEK